MEFELKKLTGLEGGVLPIGGKKPRDTPPYVTAYSMI